MTTTTKVFNDAEDLVLVEAYQNGDEYAFSELYVKHQAMIHEVIGKFYKYKQISYEEKMGACHEGFTVAAKKFKPDAGKKFSTFLYGCMIQKNLDIITKIKRNGRLTMLMNMKYYHAGVKNGDVEFNDLLDEISPKENDLYFISGYNETQHLIEEALVRTKDILKPFMLSLVLKETRQTDVSKATGCNKQVIEYQIRAFKNRMQTLLEENGFTKELVYG